MSGKSKANARKFIEELNDEVLGLFANYEQRHDSVVVQLIAEMRLDGRQSRLMNDLLRRATKEALYVALLRLESAYGDANRYEVRDSNGNLAFEPGDLESLAVDVLFQEEC